MSIRVLTWQTAIAAALAAGAIATAALAQDGSDDDAGGLSRADANGDGVIERSELVAMRETMFARLDRDDDGAITSQDRPPARLGRRFDAAFANVRERFDADSNGEVSRSEMVDGPTPEFDAADADGDDAVTADELSASRDS